MSKPRHATTRLFPNYRGRFAPSPTGPLHFGSLVAATASFLDARAGGGRWLVRMEDLDPPREKPGAADAILRTLEDFGFEWDEDILYQSSRLEAYAAAVADLASAEAAYACTCSRREIASAARPGLDGPVYPGTCRAAGRSLSVHAAIRVVTGDRVVAFADRVQGRHAQRIGRDIGDFVIRRADGLFAYQLAVVMDDAHQGITHVVRGADLLLSTPRQIYLQELIGAHTPAYAHVPVVLDAGGNKLSKRDAAHPVDSADPVPALSRALAFLGQHVPESGNLRDFWSEALANWDLSRIGRVAARRG
jgi:glutamyl-Q tRNA(Asp) synthetase